VGKWEGEMCRDWEKGFRWDGRAEEGHNIAKM
jgi:hypothetical protein